MADIIATLCVDMAYALLVLFGAAMIFGPWLVKAARYYPWMIWD